MPTYVLNARNMPQGGNDFSPGFKALADVFAGPSIKDQALQATTLSKIDRDSAAAAKDRQELADLFAYSQARDEMSGIMADETLPLDERMKRIGATGFRAGKDFWQYGPQYSTFGAATQGAGYPMLDRLNVGAGMSYGNTQGGFREGESTKLRMNAADNARELEIQEMKNALERESWGVVPATDRLEIETKASTDIAKNTADNERKTREWYETPVEVLDPSTNTPKFVTRRQLLDAEKNGVDIEPLLSKSDYEGLQARRQTEETAGIPLMEGTNPTSQDTNTIRIIENKMRSGEPLTRSEALAYWQAYTNLYVMGPIITGSDGSKTRVAPNIPAPGLPRRDDVLDYAMRFEGGGVAEPGASEALPPGDGTPVPTPGQDPSRADVPGVPAPSMEVVPGKSSGERMGQDMSRTVALNQRLVSGIDNILKLYEPGKDAQGKEVPGYNPGVRQLLAGAVEGALSGPVGSYIAQNIRSPEDQKAAYYAFMTIEPLLRLASGAATPDAEVNRYQQYVPQPGESEELRREKLRFLKDIRRDIIDLARYKGLDPEALYRSAGRDKDTADDLRAELLQHRAEGRYDWPPVGTEREDPDTGIWYRYKGGPWKSRENWEVIQR